MTALCVGVLLVIGPPAGAASFSSSDAGTAAAQFLKLGLDARGAAMGEAMRAVAGDASAVYWNPAGLATLDYSHATVTHGAYYQSIYYDALAYAQPIRPIAPDRREKELGSSDYGAVGFSLLYLNAGKISGLDNTGAATGESFTPQDLAASAAWGVSPIDGLDLGLTGKYISSRIKDTASTGAVDAGARLRGRWGDAPIALAVTVQNFGGRLKFIRESDPIPLTIAAGVSARPLRNWTLAADVVAPRDAAPYPALGAEARASFGLDLSAAVRLGYSGRTNPGDLVGFTGLTAGGGLNVGRFGFDYAWAPYGLLGDTQRFSLSYRF